MSYAIDAVLTGKARSFRGDETSAIAKMPVDGALRVGLLGIDGDEQADLTVHGGVDKAIHHYPRDHYDWWAGELGDHALLGAPGAFGENISTEGLIESEARIGDRYRMGSALVEISQGRQPCWKLGHRFGIATVPATVVTTRRSGWYYRVIEEGSVAAGDALALVERPLPEWSVERVFHLLVGGAGKREPEELRALAAMDALATSWRARAEKLLG
ncbi:MULTISPECIES: MOSC domain-containing protein [unclassified Sphingopyxis]|uniref:MOSC domain-containing protein n=1 Tax=unclassified Sphingopyxis TaxID=2614943 RepID=UPI0007312C6C|nr:MULTISPECIES: MOSC domain-containing protein [unclassified Sphingopyxis]KTE26504.1 molybdenum cofactor biosysynthesis protein [Sphingopyxis sp. H057]KTE52910.1 molybdenum cofactor biosysynthesis protein [Sphingopyxis sp. H073]KTE55099.1 molybdenum cofactor biosysynthesis protein [Sphingopyxis sp. H071]KTE59346.1 molybdenum cofactor biosysynthesis protein [Sphingopyxis sp. H107]KTE64146.1 molybdenum cofactor biosysynthesis protein [Sphingopyxis sp. H100]